MLHIFCNTGFLCIRWWLVTDKKYGSFSFHLIFESSTSCHAAVAWQSQSLVIQNDECSSFGFMSVSWKWANEPPLTPTAFLTHCKRSNAPWQLFDKSETGTMKRRKMMYGLMLCDKGVFCFQLCFCCCCCLHATYYLWVICCVDEMNEMNSCQCFFFATNHLNQIWIPCQLY